MDKDLLPSDSSDDDYDPGNGSDEDEEVSDVEEGEPVPGDVSEKKSGKEGRKRKKLQEEGVQPRKRRGGIRLDDSSSTTQEKTEIVLPESDSNSKVGVTDATEKEKQETSKANRLWSEFMKVADARQTTKITDSKVSQAEEATSEEKIESSGKVQITRVFDFAGEEVRIKASVDADSKEAKQLAVAAKSSPVPELAAGSMESSSIPNKPSVGANRQLGLAGVLNKLGAKKKISVLDKSMLDWKDFKHQEGIDDELKTFNKGKDGYIEKQAFLQRADLRQFEVEKSLRMAKRSNR